MLTALIAKKLSARAAPATRHFVANSLTQTSARHTANAGRYAYRWRGMTMSLPVVIVTTSWMSTGNSQNASAVLRPRYTPAAAMARTMAQKIWSKCAESTHAAGIPDVMTARMSTAQEKRGDVNGSTKPPCGYCTRIAQNQGTSAARAATPPMSAGQQRRRCASAERDWLSTATAPRDWTYGRSTAHNQ